MRQHNTGNAVDQCIDIRPAHQFAPLLHQARLRHLGLDLDVISVRLTARMLPLAPHGSQVGNTALIEQEAAPIWRTVQLADLGLAAIKLR